MARRLKRLVSIFLSLALVVQTAAAQTLTGRAIHVSPTPIVGPGLSVAPAVSLALPVLSLSAPALPAPSLAATPAPVVAVTPAAAVAAKIQAAAPALQALAKPETAGSAASAAGRDLENILTGAPSAAASDLSEAVAGVPSAALAPSLSAPSAAPESPKAVVPAAAPAPAAPKTVESASSYYAHRMALKTIAAVTGAVFSLPQAGAALTAKIIASAADKQLVVSDFDDTLAGYNAVLPAEKVEAIRAIRKAGKHFAVVSDRGDEKRAGSTQLTVFESLASLPADVTEGMFVAANSGGKLYQFKNGAPVKVWEAEPLAAEKLEAVKEASAATIARLSEAGVEQHPGDSLNPKESYNTYGYALMIKVGATPAQMKQVAAIMGEELAKRGIEVEVMGRLPKDPKNPGYATFSIITKAPATAKIAELLGLSASQALVIGDMMYVPRAAKKASWMTRLGLKLSGLEIGETGNETDRNMSKGLPGVLALGVGHKMDPRIPNGWNLAGHGPEVTQKVLEAVASKPAKTGPSDVDKTGTAVQLGLLAGIVGLGALGYYALFSALGDIFRMGEEAARNWGVSPFGQDAGFFLGATTLGMVGMIGANRPVLSNPVDSYATALKQARELAVKRGASADAVRFVEATASTPARDGAQWHYTFSVPGALVYVDFSTFLGTQDFKTRVYEGAPSPANAVAFPMTEYLFGRGVAVTPEAALGLLRTAAPSFGAGASVSLAVEEAAVSGDKDAWYRFYDDHGAKGSVNARTGEVRVDTLSAKAAPSGLKYAVEPNELYALALENIAALAAKDGVSADKIKFLSAVHEARSFNGAWVGDEWRFFFGVGALEYMVPARRTMVAETMMDAFEPKLRGTASAARLAEGITASYFNMGVKTSPEAALKAVDGVTRVSLLPRVEPVSGDKDLWYSLQGGEGELAAVNARTGEIRKAAPAAPKDSALKSFLLWLAGASAVAAIYGAFYWAASHAPVAVPTVPEGWQGPIPTIEDFFRGMGGVLGLGALAGTLRAKKAAVTDEQIAAAAKSVVASKGGIWSQTEYNMGYYNTLQSLKERGATEAQLAQFKKLCDEAPVIGGRFNPWSGD